MLAALSICLLGAQGVLPALHQSLVSHRVCAEHGELIEAHASDGAPDAHAAPESSDRGAASARSVAADQHDDHCDCVLGAFLTGSDGRSADTPLLSSPGPGAISKIAAADVAATREVLAFAPKLSPPV